MNTFELEELFDDLKKGRISETEAEWSLKRMSNSSCMNDRIGGIVRDTVYGRYDPYEARREFERVHRQCEGRRTWEDEDEY